MREARGSARICVCVSKTGGAGVGGRGGGRCSVGELACKPFPEVSTSSSAPVQTCLLSLSLSLFFLSTEHSQKDRHQCGPTRADVRTQRVDRATELQEPCTQTKEYFWARLLSPVHIFSDSCSTPQIPNLYKSNFALSLVVLMARKKRGRFFVLFC